MLISKSLASCDLTSFDELCRECDYCYMLLVHATRALETDESRD